MLKQTTRQALEYVPFKLWLVKHGALLPPAFKTHSASRILRILKSSSAPQTELVTNLGMHAALRVTLPWTLPDIYFFARPEQYHGEQGALRAACALSEHSDSNSRYPIFRHNLLNFLSQFS